MVGQMRGELKSIEVTKDIIEEEEIEEQEKDANLRKVSDIRKK